ncbi:MAG: dihydropteroate synthase [Bacteroidaceae bacterium]|nr:dihydropteroate synthase [Bacteroidaceae bacterium]
MQKVMFKGTINVNGQLLDLSIPKLMGIVNLTPDSFFEGSRAQTDMQVAERVRLLLTEGADILDVGAYSSRPGADDLPVEEEMRRLREGLSVLRKEAPGAIVSVDTFRADVAKMCIEEYGVAIINDISGGKLDSNMFSTVARAHVPYIIMHMQGTPQNMQQAPHYEDVLKDVMLHLADKVRILQELKVNDIILDPGFGFGKTQAHNFELLAHLNEFDIFQLPLLVGVSRKSMIYKTLDITPAEALNGTTVLHTIALSKGANILRVHDVKEAVEAIKLWQNVKKYEFNQDN